MQKVVKVRQNWGIYTELRCSYSSRSANIRSTFPPPCLPCLQESPLSPRVLLVLLVSKSPPCLQESPYLLSLRSNLVLGGIPGIQRYN